MAIPTIVGTANGGIAGAGSFVVTPPAGAGGYLAVAQWYGALTDLVAPTGWTLVTRARTGDEFTNYGWWTATSAPGDTWSRADTGYGAAVAIAGYSGPVTIAQSAGADDSLTCPTVTTSEGTLVVRLLANQHYSAAPTVGYPAAATLGRVQRVQAAGGEWFVAALSHHEQAAAGATGTAAYTLTGGTQWGPRAQTITLTTPTAGANYTAAPADTLGLTDAISVEMQAITSASAADTLALTDAISVVKTVERTVTDALGLTDAPSTTRTVERAVADTVGLSDTVTATSGAFRFGKALSADRRHMVDHLGQPWAMRMTSPWGWVAHYDLPAWSGYFTNIAGKGFNATLFEVIATANGGGGVNDDGRNYAGQLPFVGGDITNLNDAYWDHIEAIVDAANAVGVTPILSVIDGWALDPIFTGKSQADCQAYGNAVATRMNGKHVLWHFGGDYAPVTNEPWDGATTDLQMRACLAGIRAAGHNEAFTVQLNYDYSFTQQNQFWERELGGDSGDGWSFVYTYWATYAAVEQAYNWTTQANQWPGSRNPRPAMFSEGNYHAENVGGGGAASEATTDETIRRQVGWAVTFGSPGFGYGDDNWDASRGSYTSLLDDAVPSQVNNLADRVFDKTGWQTLTPDTALITSGAGTKRTGAFAEDVLENDYATACRTPDGTLAFVYVPSNSGNTARSITLDLSRLGSNPTAVWYDPTTNTTSAAGAGPTYTTPAAHSDGTRDYLLEVTADPAGQNLAATPADTLGLTDTVTRTVDTSRGPADSASLADAVTVAMGVTRDRADALGLTDAITTAVEGVRSAGDTLALTDTITVELIAAGTTVLADTLNLSDAVSAVHDAQRGIADTLGLTDNITVVKTASGSVSDVLGLVDAITVQFIAEGSVTATIKVTGPFGRGLNLDGPRG